MKKVVGKEAKTNLSIFVSILFIVFGGFTIAFTIKKAVEDVS